MNAFQTAITVLTLAIFVQAGSGAGTGANVIEISQNTISFNTGNGVSVEAGGIVETFQNNDIQGNGTNGCPGCTNSGPGQ